MKKILSLFVPMFRRRGSAALPVMVLLFFHASKMFSFPIYDPFNYTPGQRLWGQTDANGDYWWEIDSGANPTNPIVIANVAVTYPGLPASPGNSIVLSNLSGGQGARVFVNTNSTASFFGNGATGAPYPGPLEVLYSLVINVTNMSSLGSGVYCFGLNDQGTIATQSSNPGTMGYRLYFEPVSSTTYQVGISKQTAGPYYATNILSTNQNVFIVVDEIINSVGEPQNSSGDVAELWVNPPVSSFGGTTEPPYSAQEAAGVANDNLTPYTSCFIFENRSTATPNGLLVGQFRFGTNWSWVTGGPCVINNNSATSNIFGTGFTLSVTGLNNGSANAYQWLLNGTNLVNGPSVSGSGSSVSGATSTTLTVTNATAQDGGVYSILVTNSVGSYTTLVSTVTVSVPEPPTFTTQPGPATVPLYPGGSAVISFVAQGTTPIVYYWHSNSTVIAVTTNNSTLTISNVQANATIYCLASNVVGTNATSSVAIQALALPAAPYPRAVIQDKPIDFWPLNEEPDNGAGDIGTSALDYMGGNNGYYTNAIIAQPGYGTGLASQFGYSPATDATTSAEFGGYPSANSTNSFVGGIPNVSFAAIENSPSFSIEAWVNSQGNPPNSGVIVAKGWGTDANGGGDQFSLEYDGGWRFYVRDASGISTTVNSGVGDNDNHWHHLVAVCNIPTTTLLLYVDGALTSSNTSYPTISGTNTIGIESISLPVTIGSAGTTASSGYTKNWQGNINDVAIYNYPLTANQVSNHYYAAGIAPSITVQPPGGTNISYGGSLTISAAAEGTAPLSYQWFDGNSDLPIAGQTNTTLTLSNLTNNDNYYLQVSNPYGTTSSQSTSVSTVEAVQLWQDIVPLNTFASVGSTVRFTVAVLGAAPITYGWVYDNGGVSVTLTNGGRISGAASNVLTISDVQPSDAGTYQLFASNAYGGPINSSAATLAISNTLSFFDSSGNGWTTQSTPSYALQWTSGGVYLTASIGNEATSAFYTSPVYIGAFEANFDYQVGTGANTGANGITFCIQNDPRGPAAVGGDGNQLGVGAPTPITSSVALEFNIYSGNSVGGVGVAVETNGAIGTVLSTAPVVINNGDPIHVGLTYLNGKLVVTLTDLTSNTVFSFTTNVNIPAVVGGPNAYVGFTGGDGSVKSSQLVTDFSFISVPTLTMTENQGQAVISWPTSIGAYVLQESSSLTTANWVNVSATPAVSNNQNQVTVSPSGTAKFYRLYLP